MNEPAVTTGYLSPAYAQSFAEFGEIVVLPESGIPLLKRPIADDLFDLVGLYPYTMCADWTKLRLDRPFLEKSGAVSVVFVVDPFAAPGCLQALEGFSVLRPMKTHLVVDVGSDWRSRTSATARRYVRKARELQTFARVPADSHHADALWAMYQTTIRRHAVTGLARLSRDAIARQLDVEGAVLVLATQGPRMLGAILGYRHGETANAHLFFLSQGARAAHSSYGLIDATLAAFEDIGCRQVNLGGVAGARDDPSGGLYRFKQNWAGETRTAFLCGEVLQPQAYATLAQRSGNPQEAYFPRYRAPGVVLA